MNKTILKNILIFVVIFGLLPPLPLTNFSSSVQAQTSGKAAQEKIKQYQAIQQKSDLRKQHFAQINADIKKIQQNKDAKQIKNLAALLEKDFKVVQQDLTQIKQELTKNRASTKILQRLNVFTNSYQKSVQDIIADLKANRTKQAQAKIANFVKEPEFVKNIQNPEPFRAVKFNGKINTKPVSTFKPKQKQSNANLSPDSIKLEKQNTSQSPNNFLSSSLQNVVQSTAIKITAIDPIYTQETEEIQFTQSVKNLAAELNYDPLNIFNYVKNNIDYTPYYGSKKGADSTLIERAGNDFDQASLLAALLRVGDTAGGHKIPTRYKQANIKIDLAAIMDLLGVEDPIAAAGVLSKTGVPYILYTDAEQNPLFFVIEHFYVEAFIDYDYTRGLNQTETEANKQWIPLDPSLSRYYYSQNLSIIEQMSQDIGFKVEDFYEQYLNGNYSGQKPMSAFKQKIETYLAQYHPDLTYEDILTQEYKQEQNFEFLPSTLPYEITESIAEFAAAPDNLKHKLKLTVQNQEKTQNQLVYQANLVGLSNKELVLAYQAASPEDQAIIDSFPSIYDVVPLALVQLKPVIKVQGQVKAGGGAQSPSVQMGRTQNLKLEFIVPQKQIASPLTEKTIDTQEKYIIAGNAEGIAINTDKIVLPELRPQEDTQTSEFLPTQKLYRTALNYLDRLQRNHDELSEIIGAKFTNTATRAIVFNGIAVSYQNNEPYSFNWTGLRIDASSVVNYYHRFNQDTNKQQKEFMFLFGLEGSLDESSIFEEDFQIEAMSTVKGLRLINQGQIAGVQTKKITMANINEIDTLQISDNLKTKYRDSVRQGNTLYTPTKQYTYQNWTGLVYISINPNTGFGGYIIGEGLNGGYTACAVPTTGMQAQQGMCYWPGGEVDFFKWLGYFNLAEAEILEPAVGTSFCQGSRQTLPWKIKYVFVGIYTRTEQGELQGVDKLEPGIHSVYSSYNTGQKRDFTVLSCPKPPSPERQDIQQYENIDYLSYPNRNYNRYDKGAEDGINRIKLYVDEWNNYFKTQESPPAQLLDYDLVKAMIMTESRMGYVKSDDPQSPSFDADKNVMQLLQQTIKELRNEPSYTIYEFLNQNQNTVLDYDVGYYDAGFQMYRITDDKEGIKWGIRWLYHKVQRYWGKDGSCCTAPYSRVWDSWKTAAARYNGGGDPAYKDKVWGLYLEGKDPHKYPNGKKYELWQQP